MQWDKLLCVSKQQQREQVFADTAIGGLFTFPGVAFRIPGCGESHLHLIVPKKPCFSEAATLSRSFLVIGAGNHYDPNSGFLDLVANILKMTFVHLPVRSHPSSVALP
jgi:hypothetical protein